MEKMQGSLMDMPKGKKFFILVILSLIAGMVYLTPFLRFTFYDQMMTALQLNDAQLGVIGATYGLLMVICYIPSGYFSERFSTKSMLLVSLIGMLVCTIWYCTYPGYYALIVIHALYGVFSVGTFWSSYVKCIRSLGTDEEQGKMFGLTEGFRGLGNCAISFGCLFALGIFAEATAGFRAVLWFNVAAFAILTVLVLIFIPNFDKKVSRKAAAAKIDTMSEKAANASAEEQTDEGELAESSGAIFKKLFSELKNPGVWICIGIMMCGYTVWITTNTYMGTYCTRVLGIDPSISSALSIVRSYLIVFIAGVTGGVIIDKFKTKGKGMIISFAGVGVIVVVVFLTSKAAFVCLVVTLVLAYMVNVIKSTYWSTLGDAGISREHTGTATAIISLIAFTSDIFSPAIVSQFLSYGVNIGDVEAGFNIMLVWMIVWSALGVGAGVLLKQRKKKLDRAKESSPVAVADVA